MQKSEVTFLLVEDDDIDARAVRRAFERLKIANPLVVAHDGIEALELLRGEGGRQALARPFLILLDINMPRMNGIEFLKAVRADPDLSNALVFVLTTSTAEQDRIEAYSQNVAGYVIKSDLGSSFLDAMEMLDHYWRVIEFP